MTAGKAMNMNSDMAYTAATTRKMILNNKGAPPVCMFAQERKLPSVSSNYFLINQLEFFSKKQKHIRDTLNLIQFWENTGIHIHTHSAFLFTSKLKYSPIIAVWLSA